MNIVVTGAAGYLGSVLVGKLLEEGHNIWTYDSLMYGQQSLLQYAAHPNFGFTWGDVEDNNDDLRLLIEKADIIIPLAAIVGAPATGREKQKSYYVNESSILNLVETCTYCNNKAKIVFPTTNSGYGTQTGEVYCTEETPLQPISPYGKQKVAAERFLLEYYPNVITLRLATVFGVSPRMRLDLLVNYTVNKALSDRVICVPRDIKDSMRNYVHIQDVADVFLYCINNFDSMNGNAYNVGNDSENMSVWDLSELTANYIQCELVITDHYKDSDKRNYIVSNEKLRKAGFEAKRNIKDEIPNLINACNMLKMLNYGRGLNRNA